MSRLEICDLTRTFRKKADKVTVLDQISLDLSSGIYGLVGPNGAGKTTLIQTVCDVIQPDQGQVFWNGKPIHNSAGFRNSLGLMPQMQKGYENFTGSEFLYYIASLKGVKKRKAREVIERFAAEVGLEQDLNKKVKAYSGGMRQRLMFIQAMLNDPSLLILDEPTAGLDPSERIRLRNLISDISKDKVIVIATHVMQDIESIADHILFLKEGKIVYQGTVENLLRQLDGLVWEVDVSLSDYTRLKDTMLISRASRTGDEFHIRCIASSPCPGSEKAVPDLEDAYLYYLGRKD